MPVQNRLKQRLVVETRTRLDNVRNTPAPESSAGLFTLVGATAIIATVAYWFGGFHQAIPDLVNLCTGNVSAIARGGNLVATSLAAICLMLLASIVGAVVSSALAGKAKGAHAVADELTKQSKGNLFSNLLVIVTLEELFARVLFLSLLTFIPGLRGVAGFYAMFLAGNFLWSAVHLLNFQDKDDRSIIRVLPQFLAGVVITYIFVKYGFTTALFVHLGFDALLFAVNKTQRFTRRDGLVLAYGVVTALVAWFAMDKPLNDIAPWFSTGMTSFKLAGWGFWDYVWVHVFLTSLFTIANGVLLFDQPPATELKATRNNALIAVVVTPLVTVFGLSVLFLGYWLLGFITATMALRVAVVALLLSARGNAPSGSGVSRAFWIVIPRVFITICALEAVGFWPAVCVVLVEVALHVPMYMVQMIGAKPKGNLEV